MSNGVNKLLFILKSTLMMVISLMLFYVGSYKVQAVDYIENTSDGLINWVLNGDDLTDGYYKLTVNDVTYPIHLYVYDGDQTWDTNMTFGDSGDAATSNSTYAQNMVVVMVRGNLTVNSGVTVTSYSGSYGGPKGMFLYVTGTLTNNGTITMTGKGARAAGENVYLWKNADGTYEYVPATGATGAVANKVASNCNSCGTNASGNDGSSRQSGGGGGGALIYTSYNSGSSTGGAGGTGTSYSGGAGGGGANHCVNYTNASLYVAGGNCGVNNTNYAQNGVGIGTGSCSGYCRANTNSGTGGLLTVFSPALVNNGLISANGVSTATVSRNGDSFAYGGASGGGSLNIFYTALTNNGNITATGGSGATSTWGRIAGSGNGGDGSVTYTALYLDPEYINPTLSSLAVDKGSLSPTFDSETFEYNVNLDSEDSRVNISANLTYEENTITSGVGTFDIPSGSSTHSVIVTSKYGFVSIYTINFYRPASSYRYLRDILIDEKSIDSFNPTQLTYNVTVPYDSDVIDISVDKGRTDQIVYGLGEVSLTSGNNTVIISVESEDGLYTTYYTLNVFREHSSKLKSLDIDGYTLTPEFDPETNTYSVDIMSNAMTVGVTAVPYDEEATVTYKGFGYIKTSGTGTITVTEPNSTKTTYTVNITKEGVPAQTDFSYSYTGTYQEFIAPATGYYQIELWGAAGQYHSTYATGKGAYTKGTVLLHTDEKLYVYVGNRSTASNSPSWNGGGQGGSGMNLVGSGGGATDVRVTPTSSLTTWNEFDSLKSRIMVAAGGGGHDRGGAGGTLTGIDGAWHPIPGSSYRGQGGTQISAGAVSSNGGYTGGFGYGGIAKTYSDNHRGGGGGGGWYGGSAAKWHAGGGGGSSYISGYLGCVGVSEESTVDNVIPLNTTSTVALEDSYSYTGYIFTDTEMIAGNATMPSTTSGYMTGNTGNGYARITLLAQPSENNFLTSITVKTTDYETGVEEEKEYTPEYDMETEDYYITVESTETLATISARPEDSLATIAGLGEHEVLAGENIYEIVVTAESGSVKIYKVHINREANSNQYPLDIVISGLVPSLCSVNESFCNLQPESFDKDTNTYYITVPSRIKQLWFDVEKGHPYQTVLGEGKTTLEGGENIVTIEVESEDGTLSTVYKYYVTRDMTGNTDLSVLEIVDPEREINYDPDVTEYYISVPNDYTEIKEINVETDDPNASYIITGNENFETGMNQVYILVTAANGETKTYIINVYREKSGNTYLSSLEVKTSETTYELIPEFNKINLGTYKATVPNDIVQVEIVAIPEVDTTTVTGLGTVELKTGTNSYTLTTTAEDGSVEIYTLDIIREKNSNTNLTGITVTNGETIYELDPSFDSSTLEYSVTVEEGVSTVGITATPEVETTTYKLLDNVNIKVGTNVKRVMAIAEDGTTKTYVITITRPASSNNYLSDLVLSSKEEVFTLTPNFDKETTEYILEVENSITSITVSGTKESNLASISGTGKYSLAVGDNIITLVVTAENGDAKTYQVKVTRKPNSNPYLSLITTSEGILVPSFDKDTLEYTVNVENTVDTIKITATPEATTTTVTGEGEYNLNSGSNIITLTTLAEDKVTTLTYTIDVIKDKSDNDNLSYLLMEEGAISPRFDPNIIAYTVSVPNDVEQATLHIELEDDKASYEVIGNENFVVGENEIIIRVTSESGLTKDYVITVTRQEKETSSNYLSSLTVDNGTLTPTFEKEIEYYEAEVEYEITKITVSATLEDSNATLTGIGTYTLETGKNLIVVNVTGVDGKTRDYQIVVTRKENDDARLSNLVIEGSTLTPPFNKDTYEYSLTTTENELVFTKIETVDTKATYEIIGNNFDENITYQVIIRVTAADKVATQDYILNVTKEPSNNNNLSLLEIEGYTISPTFNKSTTLYTLTVGEEVNNVVINAKAEHEKAVVSGIGSQTLIVGDNQFVIEVTSESGKVKAYTIVVTKEGSSNNDIESLIVNNGIMSPEFKTETLEYDVTVNYEETELDIEVLLSSEKATYKIVGNNLNVGNNTVNVIVTAENGAVKTYTLNVTREEIISALLKNLSVKNYEITPTFNSNIMSYEVLIDYEVTTLDITALPLDNDATVEISGNEDFIVGDNEVIIKVTSSDGLMTEEYKLLVTRQAYSNTFLDYLYTSEGDVTPTFDKYTLTYSIDVLNEVEEIEFFGEAVDKSATVEGLGIHSLETGENKIPITVTTTSGIKRTYYVTVNRSKNDNNKLETLSVKVGITPYNLTPEFDPTVNNYAVTVPEGTKNITISATVLEPATLEGVGTKNLVAGDNIFEIVVTSESGIVNTYTLTVTRTASSNNYLTDLVPSVGTLEPEFSYEETNYTLNLDSSAALLSFTYSLESLSSTISGIDSLVIPDGTSIREIIVTAEDGTTRTYTITVNKERSDIATLESLQIGDYTLSPEFDSNILEYKIIVPNDVKVILGSEVVATPTDSNATIAKDSMLNLSTTTENIYSITVTAPDGFTKLIYKVSIERERSSNASINTLTVNTGYLTTTFNPNVYEYTWKVPNDAVITGDSVTLSLSDINATVVKTDSVDIKGVNPVFEIVVTSEDGSSSVTYKLNIELDLSNDATLGSLEVDKGYYEPTFDSNIFEYDVYEYVDATSINVAATPKAETSTVTAGNGEVLLENDLTVHTITVTAEDGTILVYTLNIHKSISRDLGLKNLGLNGLEELECISDKCTLSPIFDTDIIEYSIKVPYEYINLDILAETINEQQTVKYKINGEYVDEYNLPIGKTEVVVEVYDGMGELTKEYTLVVERCKSNNTNLASLEVSYELDSEVTILDLEPVFDKEILEYYVTVPQEVEEVIINATAEDENSYVKVNGYNYLQEGNNDATVMITAPDGTIKTYIIHIERESIYNSYLKNITVSTGIFWELSPQFKRTVYDYTTTVSGIYDRITLEAVPVASTTIVSGTGEFDIITGSNVFVLTATAEDGSISVYTINVIKEISRNVNLTNLIVEEGNLSPTFEKGTTKYDINVDEDVDKLTIHAVLEDPTSSYIITGNENLISGENIVNVIVMSADKSVSKTYQLTVNKAKSSNNYLSSLKVVDEENEYPLVPDFSREILDYKVEVEESVEKVTIIAESEKLISTITGTGEEYLAYGSNLKQVAVTSEDGSVRVYTIDIYRNYNLDLKLIISDIGELDPNFDKDTLEYKITLPTEEDEITFVAQKESDKVSVTGSGTYDLAFGENTIDFVVTAPDGKTKTYTVIVERAYSDNNYIESLVIHEGALEPEFDRELQEYEVSVRNTVTKVGMDVILEDENATYEVIGNENLQPGSNEVIIRVTAANGEVRDYKMNVILQDDSYFSNLLLDISITNGDLNPDFDPEVNYYAATVANSITSTEITVIKENVDATVEGIGVVSLEPGRNIFQIKVTSKDGIVNTYTLAIYRNENSDATLSSLTVKNHNYLPIFNKLEENYTLNVESNVSNLEIEALPSDPNSTVEITGNKNLVSGENIVTIKVTAPDNTTTKTYTITVTKSLSTNNYLSSLTVSGYSINPDFEKTNPGPYIVNVENSVNSIVVDGTPEVETTTVTGLGSYTLVSGQNLIKVQATSESGEVRVYTLVINKSKNSDSSLKEIILSDGTLDPTFNPETLEYEVLVDGELESITVTGIPTQAISTVSGNGIYTLEEAETEIKLEVEAEDGSKTTYKVKVIKEIELSSKIEKLVIKEGELYPTFHKNTTSYTILVPNEITELNDMEVTLEDENATYEIIGNNNFIVGSNTVTIRVTAADSSSITDYTISVVRQISASNYLKDLQVVGYTLNPVFDKNTLYYVVNVPNEVEQVQIKATKEDTSATLSGTGYKTLNYSENRYYITVTSQSGAVRTYSVVVNRTLANENLLLSLTPSVGTLDPTFDSYTNEYTLEVPEKTTELTLEGTSSTNTTVVGLGTSNVVVGEQTRTITVTSQTGETNIYTVKVVRPGSTNTELDSLTPSSGTLEYSNDILEYEMIVEDNVSVISFDVVTTDSDATVTGNGLTTLNYGENQIAITVTAEDKVTTREIKITVTRQKEIAKIIPSKADILLAPKEEETITYTLKPIDTSYTEVEWISNNENIATVDESGKITAIDIGSTTIEIRSKHNPLISATITVNVISKEITSSIYDINKDGETPYVIGSNPKTAISDFISNFDNNPSTLHVYNEYDTEITDLTSFVGSYAKVKLVINEVIYDELTIVVRGDFNSDGLVTATDLISLKNLILGKDESTYISSKIGDITQDDLVTAPDLIKVKNYILGKGVLN